MYLYKVQVDKNASQKKIFLDMLYLTNFISHIMNFQQMLSASSIQSINQHAPVSKELKKLRTKNKYWNNFIKRIQKVFGAGISSSNEAKVFEVIGCNTATEKQNDSNNATKDLQPRDQDQKHNKEDTTKTNQQVTSENQQSECSNGLQIQFIKQGVDHQDKNQEQITKSNSQSQLLKQIPQLKQILQETKETHTFKTQQSISKDSHKQKLQIYQKIVNDLNQKLAILQQEMRSIKQGMISSQQIMISSQQNSTLNKESLQEIIQQKIQENNQKVKQLVIQQKNKILTKQNQNTQLLINRLNEINDTQHNFITQNKYQFDQLSQKINLCKQQLINDRNLFQQKIDRQISSLKTQINKNLEEKKNLSEKKNKEIQTNNLQNHVLRKIILLVKNLLSKSSSLNGLKCLSNQIFKQDNLSQSKILQLLKVFLNYNTNLNNVLQKRSTKSDEESHFIREYNMMVNRVEVHVDVNNSFPSHQRNQKLQQSVNNSQMFDLTNGNFMDSRLDENNNIENVQNHQKDGNTNHQLGNLDVSSIHYGDKNDNVSESNQSFQDILKDIYNNDHQNPKTNFIDKNNLFVSKSKSHPFDRENKNFNNILNKNIFSDHLQKGSTFKDNKNMTQHKKCLSNKSFTYHKKNRSSIQSHQQKKNILTELLQQQQRTSHSESNVQEVQNSDINIHTSVANSSNKSRVSSQLEQVKNIERDKQQQKTLFILIESLVRQFQSSKMPLSELLPDLKLIPQYRNPQYKNFLQAIGSQQKMDDQNFQENSESQGRLQQRRRQILRRQHPNLMENKYLLREFDTSRGSQKSNDPDQKSLIDSLVKFADKLDPPDIFLRNLVNDFILTFQNYLTAYQQSQQETQQENYNEIDQSLSQLPQCEHNPIQIDQGFYSDPSQEKQGKSPFESNKKNPP